MFYVGLLVLQSKNLKYTHKDKERGNKAYHYGKSSIRKECQQKRKKGPKDLQLEN